MTEPEESLELRQLRAKLAAANDTIQRLVNHPDQNNGALALTKPARTLRRLYIDDDLYKQLELEGIADKRGGKYSLLGDYINDLIASDTHSKEWHITRDKIGYYLHLRNRAVDAAKARHVLLPKAWIDSIDALEAHSTEIDAWLLSGGE